MNCEIGFEGLEKVLNLVKIYMQYSFRYANFVLYR